MALNKHISSSGMGTGGSINTTQVIREGVNAEQLSKDLAEASIFFNVSKIYVGLDAFTFESRIYIKCGDLFKMDIVEIWQKKYSLKDANLSIEDFNKIIKALYKASIHSIEQHIEHSKKQDAEYCNTTECIERLSFINQLQ